MVSLSQERHQLFGTSTEESYQAGSRTEEAGVCRPSKRVGINNIGKETCQGHDLIETFKIVTGRERVKMEDFFECSRSNYNLRGHQFKMTVQRSRTNTRSRSSFFSQRVVNIWNGLPRSVVSASSVNNFKNRLDDCAEWGI